MAVSESLATPAVQQQYDQRLDKLRGEVASVQNDLASISYDFQRNSGLQPLSTPLKKIEEQYKNTRWGSRDNATLISTGLEQLATTHLAFAAGVEQASPEEVVEILKSWVTDNQAQLDDAKAQVPKFNAVLDAVKQYKEQVQVFAQQQRDVIDSSSAELSPLQEQANSLQSELQQLKGQVDTIQQRIEAIKKEIKDIEGHVIPRPGDKKRKEELEKELKEKEAELQNVQNQARDVQSQVDALQAKIAPIKQRLDAAQANWDGIVKHKPAIDSIAGNRLNSIIQQVPVLQEIQRGANQDVEECVEYIAGGKKAAVPVVLTVYNQEGPNTYGPIRQSLTDYAVKVGA